MSRKLVYLNGQNETITFETGPYLIVKIEGLGIPNVDRQEQKAPYQDGTTYIDSLLQNRDIVVELAITKPNDFSNIALYRRELSQRLTPKYGLGDLTYTDEDGNSYTIRAVVSSMVFPNKDYRDPYMRAMVTFTACDPYWKSVIGIEINLPTPTTSDESIINPASSYNSSVIEKSDGSLFIIYQRDSDNYLVSRTYTTSWSAESVIGTGDIEYPSVIELHDMTLFLIYKSPAPNGYLVSRVYTTSWSSESVINAAEVYGSSVIEKSDGSLFLAYQRASDGYLVSRVYTTSWSSESVINANSSYGPCIIEKSDGNLFIVYSRGSDNYLVSRTYTTSWSSESVINAAEVVAPILFQKSDGSLFLSYTRILDYYIVSRVYTTSWSGESVINAAASAYVSAINRSDGTIFIVYVNVPDYYIVSVTRSVIPVPIVNTGDVPAPFLVRFQGPSTSPRIINQNTLEYIRLNTTLAAADSFEVDTTFGNKTVKLIQGGIEKNGIAFLDIGSTFFQIPRPTLPSLPVGVNPFRGLQAYWNMDSVPEIPDDPAGVTYLQDAWATVDSWITNNSSLSVSDGKLKVTASTSTLYGASKIVSALNGKTIRVKIIANRSTTINFKYYTGSTYPIIGSPSVVAGVPVLIDLYLASGSTDNRIYIDTAIGATAGDYFAIDWVYIGTGAYLPNSLIDNSGNGNHGTIYGATPVDGISGKALAFDGVNDYVQFLNISITTVFHISLWYYPMADENKDILEQYATYIQGRLSLRRGNDQLSVVTSNGTTGIVTALGSGIFVNGSWVKIDITLNFSSNIITFYKNGILVSNPSMATSIPFNTVTPTYLGRGALGSTSGIIDEPRIYNRELSAEEVKYLYDNPGVPIPTDATVIYYEDDAVLSTATATLEFTERYSGL